MKKLNDKNLIKIYRITNTIRKFIGKFPSQIDEQKKEDIVKSTESILSGERRADLITGGTNEDGQGGKK